MKHYFLSPLSDCTSVIILLRAREAPILNKSLLHQSFPKFSSTSVIHCKASSDVTIPPAGFKPI